MVIGIAVNRIFKVNNRLLHCRVSMTYLIPHRFSKWETDQCSNVLGV